MCPPPGVPFGLPALELPRIDRLTIWLFLLQAKHSFYRSAMSVNSSSALLLLKSGNKVRSTAVYRRASDSQA